ncbi:MAG: hypothetical protein NTAFB05_20040 [Nitrobacter sp.]
MFTSLVTSRKMADIVGDALGITRESAQLHLRVIRENGGISFSGYGRSAALMTGLDTARLVLAIVGSTYARDSSNVLGRFQNLRPATNLQIGKTLEEVLAHRIEQYPDERNNLSTLRQDPEYGKLPQIALELLWAGGIHRDDFPPQAIMCWHNAIGEVSSLEVFVPPEFRARRRKPIFAKHYDERHEVLAAYSGVGIIHSRIVTVDALIRIAEAMWAEARGPYGNAYGNTR